jgi:hypothetical protein
MPRAARTDELIRLQTKIELKYEEGRECVHAQKHKKPKQLEPRK